MPSCRPFWARQVGPAAQQTAVRLAVPGRLLLKAWPGILRRFSRSMFLPQVLPLRFFFGFLRTDGEKRWGFRGVQLAFPGQFQEEFFLALFLGGDNGHFQLVGGGQRDKVGVFAHAYLPVPQAGRNIRKVVAYGFQLEIALDVDLFNLHASPPCLCPFGSCTSGVRKMVRCAKGV